MRNIESLQFASNELFNDVEFLNSIIKIHPEKAVNFVPEELKENKEIKYTIEKYNFNTFIKRKWYGIKKLFK